MKTDTDARFKAVTYAGQKWPCEPELIIETDSRCAAIHAARAHKRSQVLRADKGGINAGRFFLDQIVNP